VLLGAAHELRQFGSDLPRIAAISG
jgi:hypothetical protein